MTRIGVGAKLRANMRPPRVLVVDDELSQRRLYCRLLESGGYATMQAESGAEALESIACERPNLIVADISMPGLDGIQLYKALHHDHRTSDIPVLLMTGLPVPRSLLQEACIGLDANEIFVKGGDYGHFIGLAAKLLRMPSTKPRFSDSISSERVVVDAVQRRIWIDGKEVPRLPIKRYDLLIQLLQRQEPQSPNDLLRNVWPESDNLKIVGVNILRLRHDIASFPSLQIETSLHGYSARLNS